jgi:hypothetical protein
MSHAAAHLDPHPQSLSLIYVRPQGLGPKRDFHAYEAQVLELAGRFVDRVIFRPAREAELARYTPERVFISKRLPTVVLIASGKVVAQGIGALPTCELQLLLKHAL